MQELSKSKQKTLQEEIEALARLEAEGVMLNNFINAKGLTRINSGEFPGRCLALTVLHRTDGRPEAGNV